MRLAIAALVVAGRVAAADMTLDAKVVFETSIPLPQQTASALPDAIRLTLAGERAAARFGDQTAIFEPTQATYVDAKKREYYRQTLQSAAPPQDVKSAIERLRALTGSADAPKFSMKPMVPAQTGPTIVGVSTIRHQFELASKMEQPTMTAEIAIRVEVDLGKPEGWQDLRRAQTSTPADMAQLDEFLTAFIGEANTAEIRKRDWDGFPLGLKMTLSIGMSSTKGGNLPPLTIPMAFGFVATSLSKTADLSLFEIPADYREVPVPPRPSAGQRAIR